MTSPNGHYHPPQTASYVLLRSSVQLSCKEGRGHACIMLPWRCATIPQVGNVLLHSSFPWPFEVRVQGVSFDIDGEEEDSPNVNLTPFDMRQLRGMPHYETDKPMKLGKQLFLECLADLTDAGWRLPHPASWRPRAFAEKEAFDAAFFQKMAAERTESEEE